MLRNDGPDFPARRRVFLSVCLLEFDQTTACLLCHASDCAVISFSQHHYYTACAYTGVPPAGYPTFHNNPTILLTFLLAIALNKCYWIWFIHSVIHSSLMYTKLQLGIATIIMTHNIFTYKTYVTVIFIVKLCKYNNI